MTFQPQVIEAEVEYTLVPHPIPDYDGDYTVTPTEEDHILDTTGKRMTQDMTVEAIPDSYVSTDVDGTVMTIDTRGADFDDITRIDVPLSSGSGDTSYYDTSDATATADKIRSGDTAYIDGGLVTGTQPNVSHADPTYTFNDNTGVLAVQHVQEDSGYIEAGTTQATIELDIQPGLQYTPGASAHQLVAAHKYTTGNIIINGDPNLTPEYIVDGVTIFGVTGTASAGGTTPEGLRVEVVRLI